MMRYRGGGVGHKSTRDATNWFLNDWDRLDTLTTVDEDAKPDTKTLKRNLKKSRT